MYVHTDTMIRMTTTIQIRTKPAVKKNAQKILANLGLDLSTAINMYLMQVILHKGVPFEVRTENGFTPAQERAMLREAAWAKKHGKRYSSTEEMFKDILGE